MTLRKEAIKKIKLLSLDDVSKLLFFMAGMEAQKSIEDDGNKEKGDVNSKAVS